MLELRLQPSILKRIALFIHWMNNGRHHHCSGTELVDDMWKRTTKFFDCSPTEIYLQAMNPSHTSLVELRLRPDAFKQYRCDRPISLGVVLRTMANILDFAANDDDVVTIKADDDGGRDSVTFTFESDSSFYYGMRLNKIKKDDYVYIPESTKYQATVQMPSVRFIRIIKSLIGDFGHDATFTISVTNEGLKFCRICHYVDCRQNKSSNCDASVDDKPEEGEEATIIEMNEPVSVECELDYFRPFTEAEMTSHLLHTVRINLTREFPVMVEYEIAKTSWFRFYSAPVLLEEDAPTTQVV